MTKSHVIIQTECIRTDVTCVVCYGNYVLAGSGSCFSVFNLANSKCLLTKTVFNGQKVHGIVLGSEETVAVYGGRDILFLHLEINSEKIHVKEIVLMTMDEWIFQLQFLNNGREVALITADNVISHWKWMDQLKLHKVACEIKCLIYSALIIGTSWENLTIFSGTVFQEVVIWRPHSSIKVEGGHTMHRLCGHKGVIFSISYDPESNLICTTSDDRSVRLWKVVMDNEGSWETASIHMAHSLFGHTARVWKSLAFKGFIVSIGEDSTVCIWNQDGKLLKQGMYHHGSRVWSIDYSLSNKIIVVGGSDGGICIWPFTIWQEDSVKSEQLSASLWCDTASISNNTSVRVLQRIIILRMKQILGVTENGSLLHFEISSTKRCKVVFHSDRFSSYCLLEASPLKCMVAIASLDGTVAIFSGENFTDSEPLQKLLEVNIIRGKIFSLKWLTEDSILVCGSRGAMSVWKIIARGGTQYCIEKTCELLLPKSKEPWITQATFYENHIICGDRGGSVYTYTSKNAGNCSAVPLQTIRQIHGKEGVTGLIQQKSVVLSIGRDKTIREYKLQKGFGLVEICASRLPFEWPAKILPSKYGFLIAGFHEVKFVVWSREEQRIILEIECGGGHRSWDCSIDSDVLTFIFLKDGSVHVYSCNLNDVTQPVLQPGFHSKDVNCLKFLSDPRNVPQYQLLVSASEDTSIRLSLLESGITLKTVAVLCTHISSVRALALWPLERNVQKQNYLLFSAGARAQLKVWQLCFGAVLNGNLFPEVTCVEIVSNILNIKSKDKTFQKPNKDTDVRYMDLCVFFCDDNHLGNVFIMVACSDCCWRLFIFVVESGKLYFVKKYSDGMCILKIFYLHIRNCYFVFTMATDGCLKFWDITDDITLLKKDDEVWEDNFHTIEGGKDLKPFHTLKLHQSGINSFDLLELGKNEFLIGTGGDDTAMNVTAFRINVEDKTVEILSQWQHKGAHLSQITGLQFLDGYIVTASVDQWISLWSWKCSLSAVSVEKLNCFCTAVADPKGLNAWKTLNGISICLYGHGMEVISLCPSRAESDKNGISSLTPR